MSCQIKDWSTYIFIALKVNSSKLLTGMEWNSASDRMFAVKRWKSTEKKIVCSVCLWGGRDGIGGQRSQMKQIKGELWPPGETLAGHKDEIQMVDSGRIIQQVWTPFKLSIKCIISIITIVIITNIITAWHHCCGSLLQSSHWKE